MGGGRSRLDRSSIFKDFGAGYTALQNSSRFFSANSNSDTWSSSLTNSELRAIKDYTGETGISYRTINKALFTKNYEDIPPTVRDRIDAMTSGINKFVLSKGIQVTRQCDFKIFGSNGTMTIAQIKDFILKNANSKGELQNDGFLSFGANNHGAAIAGSGLVIHINVPRSIGAGAYINPISKHGGSAENEFLFNRYSKFKFNLNSLRIDSSGKIHISGKWTGTGTKQSKKH